MKVLKKRSLMGGASLGAALALTASTVLADTTEGTTTIPAGRSSYVAQKTTTLVDTSDPAYGCAPRITLSTKVSVRNTSMTSYDLRKYSVFNANSFPITISHALWVSASPNVGGGSGSTVQPNTWKTLYAPSGAAVKNHLSGSPNYSYSEINVRRQNDNPWICGGRHWVFFEATK